MGNAHESWDLKQMQSLPLEAKIVMTQQRIRAWYESWKRYEIYNMKTGKTRFVTATEEPLLKENEYIETATSGWVYVSFSGGKDSTVLKHIVDSMYSDVPALFVNTGLEYPEIQTFVRKIKSGKYDRFNSDIEIIYPEMRFDEVIKKYAYPVASKAISRAVYYARLNLAKDNENNIYVELLKGTALDKKGRISLFNKKKWAYLLDAPFDMHNACCDVMKKRPIHSYQKVSQRKPIVGTLASESMTRKTQWMKRGCNAFEGKTVRSAPLSFWTEQDILEYIQKFNVPYCSVYGEIISENGILKTTDCDRTGCIFCTFGCHLERAKNRFQRLKETHPRQYEYCINGGEYTEEGKWQPNEEGLGLGKVLDYINVKYD